MECDVDSIDSTKIRPTCFDHTLCSPSCQPWSANKFVTLQN